MNELNFIKVLSESSSRKEEGIAYLEHLKTAGAMDIVKNFAAKNKSKALPAAIGAGYVAGLQYKWNKRNPKTGVSKQQSWAHGAASRSDLNLGYTKDRGEKPSYGARVGNAVIHLNKELSDIYADHPVRGAISSLPVGITAGLVGKRIAGLLLKKK